MQTKLTLRLDETVIRKAKRLARHRGTSVSRIFGDFISGEADEAPRDDLPPITASMLGVLKSDGAVIDEEAYHEHLEEKYL